MWTTPWRTTAVAAAALAARQRAAGDARAGDARAGDARAGEPPPTVGGVWTWTDASGRTFFGDTPPAEPGLRAAPVDVSPSARDAAAHDAARARAESERTRLEALRARDRAAAGSGTAAGAQRRSAPPPAATRVGEEPEPASCEARWRRYHQSAACFAPFRVVGGGVKPEAFRYCADVPMPERCD